MQKYINIEINYIEIKTNKIKNRPMQDSQNFEAFWEVLNRDNQ